MATSQQWRHAGLLLCATLVVLFIGSADAWDKCPSGYKTCKSGYKKRCETCIQTDVNHCGDCYKKCKELPNTTPKCHYGYCQYTCEPGWANCDGKIWGNGCETNVKDDIYNCGACYNKCKQLPNTIPKCNNGRCEYTCTPGWANCDGKIWHNGCEKNVKDDIYNCGACYNKCPVTLKGGEATCSNGQCGQQCKQGNKYDHASKCCVKAY